jgi:hypothetical protein
MNQLLVVVSDARCQYGSQICFCNFYLMKNHKIVYNSSATEAKENISTDSESLEFWKTFDVGLSNFKNIQILLN